MKLCECGCGKEVNLNRDTKKPNRFIKGHHNSHEEIKEKKIQKSLEHYGVSHPTQSKSVQEKTRKTNIEKFGGPCPYSSEDIRKIGYQTLEKHFGVKHVMQSKKGLEKFKLGCLRNLGVSNPSQSKVIKLKKIQTNIKHRGTEYPLQSKEVKEKMGQTNIEKYGEDNWAKTSQGRECSRKNAVKNVETQRLSGEPLMPHIGDLERICLNYLEQFVSYEIIRNDHSIFDLVAFFPDGHIPKLKLFIEFDEEYHFEDKEEMTILKQKDIDRQLVLESIPGYRVFRVSEKQWNENKEKVITDFNFLVKEILSCL